MVSLIARKKPQGTYFYAVTCERVDGKPRHTKAIYLGSAEKIIDVVGGQPNPFSALLIRP